MKISEGFLESWARDCVLCLRFENKEIHILEKYEHGFKKLITVTSKKACLLYLMGYFDGMEYVRNYENTETEPTEAELKEYKPHDKY